MNFIKKAIFGTFLVITSIGYAETRQTEEIVVKINFTCPLSEELEAFKATLPNTKLENVSYEEFQSDFTESMTKLIELVKSGKVDSSNWSVNSESNSQ